MTREEKFLSEAVLTGLKGMRENKGGPFGCVIVKNDRIIARGCNSVTATNDPTAHAEIVAIREACRELSQFQLTDCEIYTSTEPCPMCMGAVYWARPARLYFGTTRKDAADGGFDDSMIYTELSLPYGQRRIPMKQIDLQSAKHLFEEWKNLTNRKDY